MAKCLRCGADNEWIEGRVRVEPYRFVQAARDLIDQADLTCMRANEEISVAEGCPCPVCVVQRLITQAEVKS
jgi:DNA-directed RNA polymerase subunit RPC12/RpoP